MMSWIRLAVVLAACAWISACQRGPDLSRLGSPARRLVGHWATSDGNQEYFGPVDESGAGSFISVHADDQPLRQRYSVVDENPRNQIVRITLLDDKGVAGEPRTITIAEDGESASVMQDQASMALARMDDAATPEQSRYALPPPAATAPTRGMRFANASDRAPARPPSGPPANAPDGQYRYVLIGYDGMTPLYAWKRVSDVASRHIDDKAAVYSRGLARRHNYAIWLHAAAFAIFLVTTLLFAKLIDERWLWSSWIVAVLFGVLGVFVLHAPIVAGLVEIAIGLVLAVRGLFPKSDMLT